MMFRSQPGPAASYPEVQRGRDSPVPGHSLHGPRPWHQGVQRSTAAHYDRAVQPAARPIDERWRCCVSRTEPLGTRSPARSTGVHRCRASARRLNATWEQLGNRTPEYVWLPPSGGRAAGCNTLSFFAASTRFPLNSTRTSSRSSRSSSDPPNVRPLGPNLTSCSKRLSFSGRNCTMSCCAWREKTPHKYVRHTTTWSLALRCEANRARVGGETGYPCATEGGVAPPIRKVGTSLYTQSVLRNSERTHGELSV